MKKALLTLAVLLISAFALFALEGNVTWVWFENDPNVEYYRYQLDGEDDDNWTVVDWTVTEVTFTLDVTELHVLYLQQSYDGVNWSPSSYTESEIYYENEEPEEPFFEDDFEEEDILNEEIEIPEEEDDVVIEAAVIDEEVYLPEVEIETYNPLIFLDLGLGYMDSIPDSEGPKTMGFNFGYSQTFVKAGIIDIGLKADLGVYTSKDLFSFKKWSGGEWLETWQLQTYVNCMALATTKVGHCDLYGAVGPDFSYSYGKNNFENAGMIGLGLEFGVRYHRFEKITIGFAVTDHQYMFSLFSNAGIHMANRLELKASLGISF